MNYEKIYNQLIDRSKYRILAGYFERHHIIPKCMGGSNGKDNLVNLTAREHYIAHLLLAEIYPDNKKLKHAVWRMINGQYNKTKKLRNFKISNRSYERARINHGKIVSKLFLGRPPANKGVPMSLEQKEKISKSNLGKKMSIECIEKRKISKIGYKNSESTRKKISIGNTGKVRTQEFKDNLSKIWKGRIPHNKGKKHSEETKKRISESMKKLKQK